MAVAGLHRRRRGGLLHEGDEGAGPGKPLTVAQILGDDTTAEALEVDLLTRGVDLLDLYRGALSYRRLCALVTHLPADATVWRAHHRGGGNSTTELLLAAIERRITVLWATVAAAFGQQVAEEHLAGPLDHDDQAAETEPELRSLREIAAWMRG